MLSIRFMAFATNDPSFKWVMIAVAVGTIMYAIVRPAAKKKKDPLSRQPTTSALSRQRNVERQMESLLVELSEMARQITAQLDTRSQKLESLIQEADEKIAELKRVSEVAGPRAFSVEDYTRRELHGNAAGTPVHAKEPMSETATAADTRHGEIYSLADQGRSALDISRQLNRPRGEIELILALRSRL